MRNNPETGRKSSYRVKKIVQTQFQLNANEGQIISSEILSSIMHANATVDDADNKINAAKTYYSELANSPETPHADDTATTSAHKIISDFFKGEANDVTAYISQLIQKRNKHLAESVRIFDQSAAHNNPNPQRLKDDQLITNFHKSYPPIERNSFRLGGIKHKNLKFSYSRGVADAADFYRHQSTHAIYEGRRLTLPNYPNVVLGFIPFRLLSYYVTANYFDSHSNDNYWIGFMESSFYVGGNAPIIKNQFHGESPTSFNNRVMQDQYTILSTMQHVKENHSKSKLNIDPNDRVSVIIETYHELKKRVARMDRNNFSFFAYKGHNAITTMLRMIKKNSDLLSEILESNDDKSRDLQESLINLKSRVELYKEGGTLKARILEKWYEKWGNVYLKQFENMSNYQKTCWDSINTNPVSWVYILPWLVLKILCDFVLLAPKECVEEGRFGSFGLGRRGLKRIARSALEIEEKMSRVTSVVTKNRFKRYLRNHSTDRNVHEIINSK